MEDVRMHANPKGLEELDSVGLGQGRLIEAAAEFKKRLELATGFTVKVSETPNHNPSKIVVFLTTGKQTMACAAQFAFDLFPGNHDIVVSTDASVEEVRRGLGLGNLLLRTRLEVAKLVGFTSFMCPVASDNIRQKTVLTKTGFATIAYISPTAALWFKKL